MMPASVRSETRSDVQTRQRIVVRGVVQGVGFRPFVYREATARGLNGWVRNSGDGLTLEVEGSAAAISDLLETIRQSPPANARVVTVATEAIAPDDEAGFTIAASLSAGAHGAQVLPDLATCDACLAEMLDPADRRYRYPFINCTQCGPRYSIVEGMPYDRSRTSMRRFAMCADCLAEYGDPADRRFHAEPNACPACGPRLALRDASGTPLARDDEALVAAATAVRGGRILALKGLGGFHLIVDARNELAICRLRQRKRREEKPFAVMFPTVAEVRDICRLDAAAEALLTAKERPIVLLPRIGNVIAPSVAPANPRLGALLPYTPLHHLLMQELGFAVVATSGNVSDEPIVIDEDDALGRLGGIADLFLIHDRPIVRPLDDSVAQIVCGRPQLLRRARGYAPAPVAGSRAEGILAFGGHLKATVALTRGTDTVLGQHIGDLETVAAQAAHRRARDDIAQLNAVQPRLAVRDLHPDYASSRAAEASGLPVVTVQHHVAHVAAGLAEHDLAPPALGVAWDGTGYGPDGTIWGGEFLLVTEKGWQRLAHLRHFRLPGGEAAVREPRRTALGLLHAAYGDAALAMTDLPPVAAFDSRERSILGTMLARGINAPLTSSMGRLFDAFAALCGLRQRSSYEGQAAAALEFCASDRADGKCYEFALRTSRETDGALKLDWQPALESMLADRRAGVDVGAISRAIHDGLTAAIVAVAERVGTRRVVLTGGCFQNTRLSEGATAALAAAGFEPVWHQTVPPNDGGISLGQAVWAGWMEPGGDRPCA